MNGARARDSAAEGFARAFGSPPAGLVRAPGRVNLIGEHIDYCGLTVLPMALTRSVWVAFAPAPRGRVRACAADHEFGLVEFAAGPRIEPGPPGDWGNYVRAALQGVAGVSGLDLCVATDLPVAAGLSSSSALVVAVALASLTLDGRTPTDRTVLASRLAEAERYVGTAGGGMDQAASLLGRAGHAVAIDFDPLRVRPIALPAGWRVVVAHSGERAEKSGAAQEVYNRRTVETAEAALLVGRTVSPDEPPDRASRYPWLRARHSTGELLAAASDVLHSPHLERFRHVLAEADRVDAAIALVEREDLTAVGAILDASHRSLRDDYEVSTPALDELVERMRNAGAAGARLTGAGLGGCALALCRESAVEEVLAVARAFQATSPGAPDAFVAEPGDGAEVVRP